MDTFSITRTRSQWSGAGSAVRVSVWVPALAGTAPAEAGDHTGMTASTLYLRTALRFGALTGGNNFAIAECNRTVYSA